MTTHHPTNRPYRTRSFDGRRRILSSIGHLVAIAVNLVLLWVVRNLGDWDLLPFLTDDYDRVIGPISFSIIVTIIGRALRIVIPGRWFGLVTEGIATAAGFYALLQIYRVFPFDFDPEGFRWDLMARFVLIVGMFGSAVGVLVTPLRLLQRGDPSQPLS